MKSDYYTKITCEIVSPRGSYGIENKRIITMTENAWDLPPSDIVNSFRSIMFALGYSEETINEYFNMEML